MTVRCFMLLLIFIGMLFLKRCILHTIIAVSFTGFVSEGPFFVLFFGFFFFFLRFSFSFKSLVCIQAGISGDEQWKRCLWSLYFSLMEAKSSLWQWKLDECQVGFDRNQRMESAKNSTGLTSRRWTGLKTTAMFSWVSHWSKQSVLLWFKMFIHSNNDEILYWQSLCYIRLFIVCWID